eukprot:TRINITY_DN10462_c0_g1_i1.p1 TRINITY_DN10462_c0_g1~~TRINITY_DN10462_c0_g1_i1.p1  ORF type:complete len:114 (+),score=26.34 TRINITY_DN10462_c0_g1_i1:177-518(+)
MSRDPSVPIATWTGTGKAFSSGADLKGTKDVFIPEHVQQAMLSRGMGKINGDQVLAAMTTAFWDFPKPSIVAVNGLAVGGAANALANFHDLGESPFILPPIQLCRTHGASGVL